VAEIVLEEVSKIFPDGTEAVRAVDLSVPDGQLLVLVGPSGCGKTTVLRMIAGLEEATDGLIRIDDRIVNDVNPKDRDLAMVFQNYALYPHMSVFDNVAFSLKLRREGRGTIRERVESMSRMLGLGDQLKKKPGQLSGGQRQRVAMGRAIVRKPKAFLMDEPLSNLDAKLRVQMRTEISRLQRDLGVTTIYVTHDQTEAMTMGDVVAVMKKGELQQLDPPEQLYDRPANLFVAGFIGAPAMNLVAARLERVNGALEAIFGSHRLRLGDEVPGRARLEKSVGGDVVLGIRPEAIEDASLIAEVPENRRMRLEVDLREAMGSEVLIHFDVDAPPVLTEDTRELAADADVLDELEGQAESRKARFIARFSPRTKVREGDRVEAAVDTASFHFFDPETGDRLN
jgi:multiple sugar transport system ATP-binding protein